MVLLTADIYKEGKTYIAVPRNPEAKGLEGRGPDEYSAMKNLRQTFNKERQDGN